MSMTATTAMPTIERLAQFYRVGYQNQFLETALNKIVSHQIERDVADLERVERVLAEFELQYGLASDEFWARYQAGQMPDSADFVEWNAFCKMRQRLVERLRILQ